MPPRNVSPTRGRQARALRNDERILDAALAQVVDVGWAGLVLRQVAAAAGMSIPAVRDRFGDRSGLAAALWRERLGIGLRDVLRAAVGACRLDGVVGDARVLQAALRPVIRPDRQLLAARELLFVARYEPALADAVDQTLGADLADWLSPASGRLSRIVAAQHASILILALGLLSWTEPRPAGLRGEFDLFLRALATPTQPARLPTGPDAEIPGTAQFDTGDPAWERLLQATIDEVGTRGYEAATVEVIARTAGYTKGLLFARYASKKDLFIDATARATANNFSALGAFQSTWAARMSPGLADALALREFMRPDKRRQRTIGTEQSRLSWHDPEFAAVIEPDVRALVTQLHRLNPDWTRAAVAAHMHIEFARGTGALLLADLHPQAWSLPHDVVTVPLSEVRPLLMAGM